MENVETASLTEVYDEIVKAQKELMLAKDDESAARSRCINALNTANKAQRKFDALMDKIKKTAPPDTEWKRNAER